MAKQNANPFMASCPSQDILALIGSKWSMLLLCILGDGPVRSGELGRRAGGISQKMLTQTLRRLERDGIVARTVYPVVPPHVEYALTPLGTTLIAALRLLCQWAQENLGAVEAARHIHEQQTRSEHGRLGR